VGFHRAVLPKKFFGRGSVIGPGHKTMIPDAHSGVVDTRVSRWPQSRRLFTIKNELSGDDARELMEFVIARAGMAHSFLIQDEKDFSTAADDTGASAFGDVVIGVGDGANTEFELQKLYGASGFEQTRILRKPQRDSVLIGVDGAQKIPEQEFTIDHDLGRASFDIPPADTLDVTAGFKFYNHVRFTEKVDTWLNSAHVDTDMHDVNVEMMEEHVTVGVAGPVECVTDLDYYGGAFNLPEVSGVAFLSFNFGRFLVATPSSPLTLRFPFPGLLELGGPYFAVYNAGTADVTLDAYTNLAHSAIFAFAHGSVVKPHRLRECFIVKGVSPIFDSEWIAR